MISHLENASIEDLIDSKFFREEHQPWTEEADTYLRQKQATTSVPLMAYSLGRPSSEVRARLLQLGLRTNVRPVRRHKFAELPVIKVVADKTLHTTETVNAGN